MGRPHPLPSSQKSPGQKNQRPGKAHALEMAGPPRRPENQDERPSLWPGGLRTAMGNDARGQTNRARSCIFWAALLALFAGEFWLFDQVGAHRHTWIYARWNDQVQYLTEAYNGWEWVRTHGFAPGIWQVLVRPCAQGTLHAVLAVVAFEVAGGPSRSAALALNMLAMILWQAT